LETKLVARINLFLLFTVTKRIRRAGKNKKGVWGKIIFACEPRLFLSAAAGGGQPIRSDLVSLIYELNSAK